MISTGIGLLGYNMYAYCNNNPVMYVDDGGTAPDLNQKFDSPAAMVGYLIGYYLFDWYITDKRKAEPLVYDDSGTEVHLENSGEITNPIVMYEYISERRGDEVSGSTLAVVFEWEIHSLLYNLVCDELGKQQAKDLDFGKTIYDDSHDESIWMSAAYIFLFPYVAAFDAIIYAFDQEEK